MHVLDFDIISRIYNLLEETRRHLPLIQVLTKVGQYLIILIVYLAGPKKKKGSFHTDNSMTLGGTESKNCDIEWSHSRLKSGMWGSPGCMQITNV